MMQIWIYCSLLSDHFAVSDNDQHNHRRLADSTALALGLSGLILAIILVVAWYGYFRRIYVHPTNAADSAAATRSGLFPGADEIPRNRTHTMNSDEGVGIGGEAVRPLSPESVA
mmetsp:Transcript_37866/g.82423  ORF Transcript_37866/g.82423 Transcript_37866/m.82423 type:complete len:114 (+) Transcript_37866:172-513(+)